jgi:hypothetical protein
MSDKFPGGFLTAGAPAGFSVAFDGTSNSYLTAPDNTAFDIGSGDFVVECWVYLTATTDYGVLLGQWGIPRGYALRQRAGKISFVYSTNGSNETELSSTTSYALNTWYYVAAVRTSNTLGLFINSTREASASMSGVTINNSTDIFSIGRAGNAADYTTGYISNARIIKGTVPTGYSATATTMNTPTQLFPVTNTSILACQSPTIIDNSTNAFTITAGSGTKVSNFTPFAAYTGFNPALGAAAGGVWTLDEAAYYQNNRQWPIYDPYFKNTTLMLHGNGANAAQNNTFLDSSTNNFTITRNGNTTQGSFSPFSQTGWSTFFTGTSGTRLTYPGSASTYVSGTGDFTVEMFINIDPASAGRSRILIEGDVSNGLQFRLGPSNTSNLNGLNVSRSFNSDNEFCNFTFAFNTWYHVAVVRASAVYYFFVNGVQIPTQGSGTSTYSFATASLVSIGDNNSFPNDEIYKGYISNIRVSNVGRYTSNFTPSTQPFTAASGTQFLSLQNQRFVDNSANNSTITSVGSSGTPSVQAFSPFVPAYITPTTYSNWFNKSTGYLTVPSNTAFNFSTSDFTIEAWIWFNQTADASGGGQCLVSGTTAAYPVIYISTNGGTTLSFAQNSTVIASGTIQTRAWNHVAVTRSGSSLRFFVNGILAQTATYSTAIDFGGVYIGAQSIAGVIGYLDGAISNLRMLKGTALYTANFTPPAEPLTNITNTSLLTCQSSTFVDNGTANGGVGFTLTQVGGVQPIATAPFPAKVDTTTLNSAYSTSLIGGSGYFDGTTDYLSIASNAAFTFTGDFTWEGWFYMTANPSQSYSARLIDYNGGSNLLVFSTSDGTDYLGFAVAGTTYTTTTALRRNQWAHVAVSRSGTGSNNLKLFLNGTAISTQTNTSTVTAATIYISNRPSGDGYFTGYIGSYRLTNTGVYTQNFAPPTSPATSASALLLNYTNGAIFDNTAKNVLETVGNAQISTTQSKWGGSSMYFDGTGDYLRGNANLSNSVAFGKSDFTIELWVYCTSISVGTSDTIIDARPGANTGDSFLFYLWDGGKIAWFVPSLGTYIVNTGAVSANTWTHVAICRSGSTLRSFKDGVLQQAGTDNVNYMNPGSPYPFIGSAYFGGDFFRGYIDDLRITRAARYTTNFTPPTSQLQDQ